MIGLSIAAKDEMLAMFAGKVFEVALYSGDDEIADAIYQRQDVLFSAPLGEAGVRYVENVDYVRFEGFNFSHVVDHWAISDGFGVRARYRITGEPIEVSPAMDCKFRPGELRIGLP